MSTIPLMEAQTLGELEQLTMLATMRLGDGAYGAGIAEELEETAGRSVAIATVYVTLVRLEKKGLVESWKSAPEPVPGGKARRCFRVTRNGRRALRSARAAMDRMWEGVEAGTDVGAS